MWQTAQCPLRAWRMGKRDRRHGRRQRSCAPGWTPGNASIFSLCQSASLCFSLFPSFSQEHRIKLCQDIFFFFFLWVTRRWKADVMCILAVYKVTLMSLIYDHFLWLGSRTANRSVVQGPGFHLYRAFLQIAAVALPNLKPSSVYRMYVKVCMSHAYFSSSELLIF